MLKVTLDMSGKQCKAPGVISDVELAFGKTKINDLETSEHLISEIDGAHFNGSAEDVRDKFGNKILITSLSSGAKAALVVANNHDKAVSMMEVGENAIMSIIRWCRSGHIVINRELSLEFDEHKDCDVEFEGRRFMNTEDFLNCWNGDELYNV